MRQFGRRLFLVCVAAYTIAAAAAVQAQQEADSVALIDQYLDAWNAHDAEKAASYLAEEVEYYDASVGEPQVGRASAQANVIQAFMTAVPDSVWTRDGAPIVGTDGKVAFEWTFKGTNTGPWADGTPATGKPFTLRGATVMRIRDGQIAYQGDYYDALGFYRQLGLME